jgi:hypothetical protein
MSSNAEVARAYIQAIESGATGEALARFFTADVVIHEMPNRIAARGSVSDLAKALQGAERGRQIFRWQSYAITSLLAEGNRVALELEWRGITAIPIQNLPPGSEMREPCRDFSRVSRRPHRPPAALRLLRALVKPCFAALTEGS